MKYRATTENVVAASQFAIVERADGNGSGGAGKRGCDSRTDSPFRSAISSLIASQALPCAALWRSIERVVTFAEVGRLDSKLAGHRAEF